MSVYFLGGKGQVPAEVYVRLPKRGEAAKRAAIYSHVFDALFPGAQAEKRAKAIDSFDAPFFYEMLPMPRGLNPVLGFLDLERRALITNVDVYARLEEPHDFDPVILLGGVKPNTHFWVTPEGQVMEFTSSVPLEAAKKEVALVRSLGGIEIGGTAYGEFAQICRQARPRERYLGWMRMDKFSPVYELLSELESVPLERFLYQAGARLGSQIKKMHDQKMTLHQSNGNGKAPDEPLFSCLCAHSVEIHGNIVDVEGLRPIDPREHSLRVRAADVQGVLGGVKTRNLFQSASMSLFYAFALAGKSLDNFSTIAAGIFHGYAGASEPADKERITAVVRQAADATGAGRADVKPAWPYDFTYKILEWMEQGMQG